MMGELRRVAAAIASQVTRAKVTQSAVGARTILQVTALDGEAFDSIELLLPPGYVALPAAGADVVLQQVNGSRDHKVALGGDATGNAEAAGATGNDVGLRAQGRQVMLRKAQIQIAADGEPLRRVVTEIFEQLFNVHEHAGVQPGSGTSGPPTTLMTAQHLSATTYVGGNS